MSKKSGYQVRQTGTDYSGTAWTGREDFF